MFQDLHPRYTCRGATRTILVSSPGCLVSTVDGSVLCCRTTYIRKNCHAKHKITSKTTYNIFKKKKKQRGNIDVIIVIGRNMQLPAPDTRR